MKEYCEVCGKEVKTLYPDMVTNSFVCEHCYCHTTNIWSGLYDELSYDEAVNKINLIQSFNYLKSLFKTRKVNSK